MSVPMPAVGIAFQKFCGLENLWVVILCAAMKPRSLARRGPNRTMNAPMADDDLPNQMSPDDEQNAGINPSENMFGPERKNTYLEEAEVEQMHEQSMEQEHQEL